MFLSRGFVAYELFALKRKFLLALLGIASQILLDNTLRAFRFSFPLNFSAEVFVVKIKNEFSEALSLDVVDEDFYPNLEVSDELSIDYLNSL
jgi:hypothetical protein